MSYFQNDYVSNSDLKRIIDTHYGKDKPENIQEIFDAGTLNHQALLEPYKAKEWYQLETYANKEEPREVLDKIGRQYNMAVAMAKTVMKDALCSKLILTHDFRREHEWYRSNRFGLQGVRCKTDGDSKSHSTIFEYKGLGITSESQFDEAIDRFGYDQSSWWYLNVVGYKNYLIAGVSKKYPDRLFKRLVTRDHEIYKRGEPKVRAAVGLWLDYGFV